MNERYVLDPSESRFTVQAFASGALKVFAHNPTIAICEFSGELHFDADVPGDATVQIGVQAQSLQVMDKVSEKDRQEIENGMKNDVLESTKYPEISYKGRVTAATKIAKNWFRLQISGDLSLHGVTNQQQVDAQLRAQEAGVRLSGEFTILQTDYGIKLFSAMGGTMKLKDELKCRFDLLARQTA
jgi:polyisoprenoid-binding protein YceI